MRRESCSGIVATGESQWDSHGGRVAAGELWWESCGRRVLFIIGMGYVRGVEGRVIGVVEKKILDLRFALQSRLLHQLSSQLNPKLAKLVF